MHFKRRVCLLAAFSLFLQAATASADVLAGLITSEEMDAIAAQETDPGIAEAIMDRGPGLDYFESFPEIYDSSSWSASPDFPGTGNDDYLSFQISIESGFTATFTHLRIYAFPDNDGPDTLELRSSADSFGSTLATVDGLQSEGQQVFTWEFSNNPVAAIADTVEFRLYGYGSGNESGGVFGPDSFESPLTVNGEPGGVHIEGTASAIPEPTTIGLLAGLLAVGAVSLRRSKLR